MNNEIKTVREWLLGMSGGRFSRVECPDVYANIPVQAPVFASASEGGRGVGDLFSFSGDSETIMVFPRPRGHLGGALVIVMTAQRPSGRFSTRGWWQAASGSRKRRPR